MKLHVFVMPIVSDSNIYKIIFTVNTIYIIWKIYKHTSFAETSPETKFNNVQYIVLNFIIYIKMEYYPILKYHVFLSSRWNFS